MKRLLIPLLALAVTACGGLSEKEIAAYKGEIEYASSKRDFWTKALGKMNDLYKKQQSQGIFLETDVLNEYSDNATSWSKYETCLTEYQEIKEPLPKAKTQCKQRAEIDL